MMKATVKRGSRQRLKTAGEAKRDVARAAKGGSRSVKTTRKAVNYPIAETLRWAADGEKLLIKWGAIRSPGAKRVANMVGQVLSVMEALAELRKA
jgi:hypothetical protein